MTARRRTRVGAVLAALLLLSACGTSVSGTAQRAGLASGSSPTTGGVPPTDDPTVPTDPEVVLDGPSGPKDGVPRAKLKVTGDAGTKADTTAINTVADLYEFYEDAFPTAFPGKKFVEPSELVSYDSTAPKAKVCGLDVTGEVNAFFVSGGGCSAVAWDRGTLMPLLEKEVGELAGPTILAHEIGHLIQNLLGQSQRNNSVLVLEQQADCYAGAYWNWVAEGNSTYYDLNQGEGMREVLTAMLYTADPVGSVPEHSSAHGTGFDRTLAFQIGYGEGIARCSEIDQAEVDSRIQQFNFVTIPKNADSVEITEEFLDIVATVAQEYFEKEIPGYVAPTLQAVDGDDLPDCGDRPAVAPVDFCPDTNTVSYDLDALHEIGTPTKGFESTNGDFSAVVMVVSRLALAGGGDQVNGAEAGLTALCQTGAWARWMREPQGEQRLVLGPADLNRAVYQVISSPVPAGDVAGPTQTTVFDQVRSFSAGVVDGSSSC